MSHQHSETVSRLRKKTVLLPHAHNRKKNIFERRHQQRQQLQHNNNNNKIDKRLYAKTKIEKGEEVTKKEHQHKDCIRGEKGKKEWK